MGSKQLLELEEGRPQLRTTLTSAWQCQDLEVCNGTSEKQCQNLLEGCAEGEQRFALCEHADTFVQIDTHFEGNGIQSEELDHCIIRQLDDDHVMESTFSQLETG